jgi:5-methylcytosine-specific restriction endonuclease McrA
MIKFPKLPNFRDAKNYLKYRMSHTECERCSAPAQDVHHIVFKGMGGRSVDDRDINLIALCRSCHDWAHSGQTRDKRILLQILKEGVKW